MGTTISVQTYETKNMIVGLFHSSKSRKRIYKWGIVINRYFKCPLLVLTVVTNFKINSNTCEQTLVIT